MFSDKCLKKWTSEIVFIACLLLYAKILSVLISTCAPQRDENSKCLKSLTAKYLIWVFIMYCRETVNEWVTEEVISACSLKRTNLGHYMQQASFIQIWFTFVSVPVWRREQAQKNVSSHLVKIQSIVQNTSFYWAPCSVFKYNVVVYLSFLLNSALLCPPKTPGYSCLCVFHS